jgi:hypothetical protein
VGLLIEGPELFLVSISVLGDKSSVVNNLEVSASWELTDKVEWSLYEEAVYVIELSWLGNSDCVSIDELPLLAGV